MRRVKARSVQRAQAFCLSLVFSALLGVLFPLSAATREPGIVLTVVKDDFVLSAYDEQDAAQGPRLRVVLGSPAHPTPSGVFPLRQVVRNPSWRPGPIARGEGATPEPPSSRGPLGIAKIPFGRGGEFSLHGGGSPILLGKPVSLGCVRLSDADLLALLSWLEERKALTPGVSARGEVHQKFQRPSRLLVQ